MRRLMPFIAAAALFLSTPVARADLGQQLAKLLPNDGAAFDYFGWSVAIDGNTVIVGANQDDDNGEASGSAYVFDTATGQQIAKLLPSDGEALDLFGVSVAISGTTAIVGAYGNDDNGDYSGSAYLFDTATGQQIAKLLPNDGAANDRFGESAGVSGTTAIVGAYLDDDSGTGSGSAYLFDTTTGQQIAKLLPDDGAEGDQFGRFVAISGTTAIVGAPQPFTSHYGSAYLFDSTTGEQIAKLHPDDGAESDLFGWSVAISGTAAIVGASRNDDNGEDSGSAYVFVRPDGGWVDMTETAKLLPNDGAALDRFGFSVAISGTTAIVGAYGHDNNGTDSGSAYLFDTTTGAQIAKLLADDGEVDDLFGWCVEISGTTAIVGAVAVDDNGSDSGSAYLFDAAYCPWDFDDDEAVGASDLAVLLGSWGPCAGCPADFDGDGNVDAADLATLLGNWGPCP